jgi:hypothetical protein
MVYGNSGNTPDAENDCSVEANPDSLHQGVQVRMLALADAQQFRQRSQPRYQEERAAGYLASVFERGDYTDWTEARS